MSGRAQLMIDWEQALITQTQLKELLHYDPQTGIFTWKVARGSKAAGSLAGTDNRGYLVTRLFRVGYANHRLAWLYMYGKFPELDIDHINRVKHDNRIVNLREATASQNQQNTTAHRDSTTGVKGVSWSKRSRRYRAAISVGGKRTIIGYYGSISEAAIAYAKAADSLHGDFARAHRISVD